MERAKDVLVLAHHQTLLGASSTTFQPAGRAGGSDAVEVLRVGKASHRRIGPGGERPDGAAGRVDRAVVGHDLPVDGRVGGQGGRRVVGKRAAQVDAVGEVGGRVVRAQVELVAGGAGAGAPAQVSVHIDVGGCVGRRRAGRAAAAAGLPTRRRHPAGYATLHWEQFPWCRASR